MEEVRTSSKQASILRMPLNIVQKPAAKPWCNEQNEMWVLVFSLHYDRISSEVTCSSFIHSNTPPLSVSYVHEQ